MPTRGLGAPRRSGYPCRIPPRPCRVIEALHRRPLLAIFLLATLMALAFQGSRGLWDPDEGRYSNVALQMLKS